MPRNPIDYSKNINYKIVCKNPNIKELYVGSTTEFIKRKNKHKSDCNCLTSKGYNFYIYQFIRENGGWNNWQMIEIEKYPCKDSLDAKKRERYLLETLQASLNMVKPSRTIKEYYIEYQQNNKEELIKKRQIYNETNREKRISNNKEYYIENLDKIKEYQKKYREENREQNIEYSKEYYQQNKDKLKETITCICGTICRKDTIKRHERTNKHIQFVEQNK
jgi:hypothetical protein